MSFHVKDPALMPDGYWEWTLCQAYGCTPSALDDEDPDKLMRDLGFHNAEVAYRNAQIAAAQK